MLAWGALLVAAGLSVAAGKGWARWFGALAQRLLGVHVLHAVDAGLLHFVREQPRRT